MAWQVATVSNTDSCVVVGELDHGQMTIQQMRRGLEQQQRFLKLNAEMETQRANEPSGRCKAYVLSNKSSLNYENV